MKLYTCIRIKITAKLSLKELIERISAKILYKSNAFEAITYSHSCINARCIGLPTCYPISVTHLPILAL